MVNCAHFGHNNFQVVGKSNVVVEEKFAGNSPANFFHAFTLSSFVRLDSIAIRIKFIAAI